MSDIQSLLDQAAHSFGQPRMKLLEQAAHQSERAFKTVKLIEKNFSCICLRFDGIKVPIVFPIQDFRCALCALPKSSMSLMVWGK